MYWKLELEWNETPYDLPWYLYISAMVRERVLETTKLWTCGKGWQHSLTYSETQNITFPKTNWQTDVNEVENEASPHEVTSLVMQLHYSRARSKSSGIYRLQPVESPTQSLTVRSERRWQTTGPSNLMDHFNNLDITSPSELWTTVND